MHAEMSMFPRTLLVTILLFFAAPILWAAPVDAGQSDWVVDAKEARSLIEAKKVSVLDTRGDSDWASGHAPGALLVKWQKFSHSKAPEKGKLLEDDAELTKKLQKLGISKARPVLVVGKPPNNWGEDGRIVWMLRTLGHPNAALVSGGHRALEEAGLEMTKERSKPKRGDFVVKRTSRFDIDRAQLRKNYKSKDFVLVDTREKREFDGKTPYGEKRGGHVAGAKHLHYTELMDANGRLLPKAKLVETFKSLGISPDKKIVAYCTGGVRSAWLVAVLADLGYPNVRNYAGSMWDWAAAPADEHPLTK
jgi:thiosulfate/3-mercaptopyruvate sulfurtransferase